MVKTTTKTKSTPRVSKAKSTKSTAASHKKSTVKKVATNKIPQKVDYYPNRVPFYTAVAAVMILLLLAVIVSL